MWSLTERESVTRGSSGKAVVRYMTGKWMLALLFGLALGAAALLCDVSITDRNAASIYIAIGVLLLLCVLPPILSGASLVEPIYPAGAFYFLAYGVGAILLVQFPESRHSGAGPLLFAALAVAAAGYASLVCGYFSARLGFGRYLPRLPDAWSPLKTKTAIVLLYGLGWVARLLLIFEYHVFFNDVVGEANKVTYIGFILIVESFCTIAVVLVMVLEAASSRDRLTGVALMLMLPTEFFLSLLRGTKGGPLILLGMFFLVRYMFRRIRLITALSVCVVSFILVFLFVGTYRSQGFGYGDPTRTELSTRAVRRAALKAALDVATADPSLAAAYGLGMAAGRLNHVNDLAVIVKRLGGAVEFQMGRSYASFVASVVPRFLWPDRPTNVFDNRFAQRFGFVDRANFVTVVNIPTAPVEMYINFGIAGVVIGMFLFGAFMRIGYEWLVNSAIPSLSGVLVYGFFLTACMASLELPFASVYITFSRELVLLLVVLWCIKARQPRLSKLSA